MEIPQKVKCVFELFHGRLVILYFLKITTKKKKKKERKTKESR